MNLTVLLPGVAIAAGGMVCLLFPLQLARLVESLLARGTAKWVAVAVRLALGALLLTGAGSTRHPGAVALFGGLLVVVGVVLLLLPGPRFEALARWSLGLSEGTLRLAGLAALALGAWLAWAAAGVPGA